MGKLNWLMGGGRNLTLTNLIFDIMKTYFEISW